MMIIIYPLGDLIYMCRKVIYFRKNSIYPYNKRAWGRNEFFPYRPHSQNERLTILSLKSIRIPILYRRSFFDNNMSIAPIIFSI
jgi:hypothetical protein